MAITGNLRTMQLSELLQWLSMGQKTGTLVVRGREGEKKIFFQGGRIISSSSTIEREYLGHFLVSYGYISEEELTRAMEVQEESKILLGKILVMIGAIREEELADLIRLKASETIYDIFLWTEGAFEFIDGQVPQMPMIPISADVTGIVMEGLRRFDEWQRIRTKIKGNREIPALVAQVDLEELAERERLILHAIDGIRSIDQISLATHNPEFHVSKLVYDLLDAGHAEIIGERVDQVDAPDDLGPEDPYETVFEEAAGPVFDPADGLLPEAPPPPPAPAVPNRDFSRFLRRGPDSAAFRMPHDSAPPPAATRPDSVPSAPAVPAYAQVPQMAPPTIQAPVLTAPPVYAPPSPPPTPVPPIQRPPHSGYPSPPRPAYQSVQPAPTVHATQPALQAPARTTQPAAASGFQAPAVARPSVPAPGTYAPPPNAAQPRAIVPPPAAASSANAPSIPFTAVPRLTKPMEELMSWSFTPNEAFIVSRINGLWDVKSIVRISPFPEGEVLRVFHKLHDGGVIAWR